MAVESAGERLDRFLATALAVPRNQVQQWIADGAVEIGGRAQLRPSTPVGAGVTIDVAIPTRDTASGLIPEAGEVPILFVDSEVVVVDKPAGLTVHPGAGRSAGTLVHRLLAHFPELGGVGGSGRPGIVHRLDKDTSGALVVARTVGAYQALVADFARRAVDKTYLAIVWGTPKVAAGRIELAIGRHPSRRTEMTVRTSGRASLTTYRTLASAGGVSLLALGLATGRTHQIRVHAKAIGHPLVGDPVYGEERWRAVPRLRQPTLRDFARPALHAWRLAFRHPVSGERLAVEAPPPADLVQLWTAATGAPWPVLPPWGG